VVFQIFIDFLMVFEIFAVLTMYDLGACALSRGFVDSESLADSFIC
jgi:hypothetical protein